MAGAVRTGGFGGAEGLARYLREEAVDLLIDATHPFAATMQTHAAEAARLASCAAVRLARPPWPVAAHWQTAASLLEALSALPAGARAFLAVGAGAAVAVPPGVTGVLRSIEPPRTPLPPDIDLIRGHPGATVEAEAALFQKHAITHLVCRNSGGAARAKLDAAEALGLQIILIDRPTAPPGLATVTTVEAALDWVRQRREVCLTPGSATDNSHT